MNRSPLIQFELAPPSDFPRLNFPPKWDVLSTALAGRRHGRQGAPLKTGMVTHNSGAGAPEAPQCGFLRHYLFRTGHKAIGLQYLWLALFSVFVGMIMSLVMRVHLIWPGLQLPLFSGFGSTPERYAALTLLHGSVMVFMVLTAAPQAGLGNYLLPIQIGARDLAFPTLNMLAFWATAASLLGITAAFFLQPEAGITLWVASVALFCAASLANAVNFSVTTIDSRANGMTLPRLPITVWAWFLNAALGMLIFSILLAACVYLLADRLLGTHFYSAAGFLSSVPLALQQSEFPIVWHRLFWFFAQAQVYVAMLPCFGIATHLLSTFSRKPVWAHRAVVLALCGVGLFGFCVWGQHMFASGLNPYSPFVFSLLASSLGLPASILAMSWFGTLWNAKLRLTTAMLFALGFVSLFLSGGLSGLILARHDITTAAASDDFVTGHFHLVMGVAATFAMLGALFFWFPKMFGRRLDERLGKIHFWLTFAGVYCVFMPMHWLGLLAHSKVVLENPRAVFVMVSFLQAFVTTAILFTTAAQTFFVANVFRSLRRVAEPIVANPWRSTTLEWSLPSPPALANFTAGEPVVYRGAYEFSLPDFAEDFVPQHLPRAADELHAQSQTVRGASAPPATRPAEAG
jgi:cytochrome c oxidase subunit 1